MKSSMAELSGMVAGQQSIEPAASDLIGRTATNHCSPLPPGREQERRGDKSQHKRITSHQAAALKGKARGAAVSPSGGAISTVALLGNTDWTSKSIRGSTIRRRPHPPARRLCRLRGDRRIRSGSAESIGCPTWRAAIDMSGPLGLPVVGDPIPRDEVEDRDTDRGLHRIPASARHPFRRRTSMVKVTGSPIKGCSGSSRTVAVTGPRCSTFFDDSNSARQPVAEANAWKLHRMPPFTHAKESCQRIDHRAPAST